MCGIIGVVRRPSERTPPTADDIVTLLEQTLAVLPDTVSDGLRQALDETSGLLDQADLLLRGPVGVRGLLGDRTLIDTVEALMADVGRRVVDLERQLDQGAMEGSALEAVNAALVRVKDPAWAIQRDRLRTARAVADLAGAESGVAALTAFTSVQQALSALDRLEVRGRDSAGLQVTVWDHRLELDSPALRAALAGRGDDSLYRSRAVRTPDGHLVFVYKTAAEIGELGDNTAALRAALRDDTLLHEALAATSAQALVLGHTRWASVGIISEPNAHPLESSELDNVARPHVTAVLNGDVDNYADLKSGESLRVAEEITTDAKIIPTLTSRNLDAGFDLTEAFRRTVASLEGSVAIAAAAGQAPERLLLALRGSGQALYVGLAEDAYIVASEPYGVVEETNTYLRLDGETPASLDNPTASRGQIVELDGRLAGDLAGITRRAYDATPLPVDAGELDEAQITTRDIDRGSFPHYLLKEMCEAPNSFRKTLRGKLVEVDGSLTVRLGDDTLSTGLRERLAKGHVRRTLVIGQGTAHIAGMSFGHALRSLVHDQLPVEAVLATELSGFDMPDDMSDTLVVAISQSGTTTDTNRTVDLVRARGATVVAVVNRRNSDLTDKADGVLYTSDGRDVEMSVASTKAFYAQIAAGFLLAVAVADELGATQSDERQALLRSLRDLPSAMTATLELRPQVAEAARQLAPSRRYWAIVGNGANVIAAREIRIKLSELCYKSIACDGTEDKKHIDLSAEPLILVCAAGLSGSTADDVAKEIAIYRAHKAAPIVVATEGQERFSAALHAILVPETHPSLAFVLAAMVGHLFGYEAALAIDAQAHPLREGRAAIESAVSATTVGGAADDLLAQLVPTFQTVGGRFFDGLRAGEYNGHLEASTAVRVASLFRYALGQIPLESYQVEFGKVGTPAVVIEDLTAAMTLAIEELTRPVDAIKHQAKTVTVGISRADETLLQVSLVGEVLAAGVPRDQVSYESLRSIAALDPVVAEVTGYTRYRVEGDVEAGTATVVVVDRGGIAREFSSRAERRPALRGTKHRVATERRLLVARGRSDGRTFLLVPEIKDNQTTGLTLVHVRFADNPSLSAVRGALQGYRNRYSALKDAVTETEPTFREDLLVQIPVADLLSGSIYELADHWRTTPPASNGSGSDLG
jgi:glucosamine--fructose-6-phosphate aminotransferase (isomerizing)